jgi:hypothetical protein
MKKITVFCKNTKGIISNLTFTTNYAKTCTYQLIPINSKKYNIIQFNITDQKLDICKEKTEQYANKIKAMLLKTIIY